MTKYTLLFGMFLLALVGGAFGAASNSVLTMCAGMLPGTVGIVALMIIYGGE